MGALPVPPVFDVLGIDWLAWTVASARVLPTALLVPAFGLRFVPTSMRIGIAAALAVSLLPVVQPVREQSMAWGLLLVAEFARGTPIAIAAAAALFAATMAGGLVDDLRAVTPRDMAESPMSTLFSLLAAVAFFEAGGASRIVAALSRPDTGPSLARAAFDVAGAISIAVAILAPLIVVALVLDVTAAFVVRATGSWSLSTFVAPIRSLVILAAAGIAFERIAEAIANVVSRVP